MSQPGYLLFLGHSLDMDKMGRYSAAVSLVHKQYGGTYVGIGGPGQGTELLEGDWVDHSIILARFPSSEDVEKFWASPEYSKVRELRKGGGVFQAFNLKGENREPLDNQPAYLISICRPFDTEAYTAAVKEESARIKSRGMYYLAQANAECAECLEGDRTDLCFSIIACSTQPSATALWNDATYVQLRKGRAGAAKANTFLMAGMIKNRVP